jgi:molybdopterin/thiamine biosynthesis adenylyltransferase/rhodanese-related sulfurtransferase
MTVPVRNRPAQSETPSAATAFSNEELRRYSRHLILPGVGAEGQQRLKRARVLLVGLGGLGSPVALYLAAAGVGHLGLVDADRVDLSNLQRQVLHGTGAIGETKLQSARKRLSDINPNVELELHETRLTADNALDIIGDYDIVVDGTDNFPTRYLINDACVILGKPNVYGSVIRFEGQVSIFGTADGPCYRCLFRDPPPPDLVTNCEEGGVFGVLPGLVGMIQATETIKLLLGQGETLSGRLLLIDALRMRFHTVNLQRDPECKACGTREISRLIDYEEFCGTSTRADAGPEISVEELHGRMQKAEPRDFDLIDVREGWEWNIARLPGAKLIPLGTLSGALDQIDRGREVIVYCHHGIRSAMAVGLLREAGITRSRSLAGGIARWSEEIDSRVPAY